MVIGPLCHLCPVSRAMSDVELGVGEPEGSERVC